MQVKVKGDLRLEDIAYLNEINARTLSHIFEKEVPPITDAPLINGLYHCYRPAYDDYIDLTAKEHMVAARCVAFSTLSQLAYQQPIQVFVVGFTSDQVEECAENYGCEKMHASSKVYALLD